ncbi:hypothetical protein [Aureibaculum marinum]|uniref:hypothetical protein n=1 Tax=Aureibaculum marinum TaxID=2487930 RepID=UPI00139670A3|nr:hypothetical protein [Aureibaculum marinum]
MKISRTQIKKAGPILKNKKSFSKEIVKEAKNKLTCWRTIQGKLLTLKIIDVQIVNKK